VVFPTCLAPRIKITFLKEFSLFRITFSINLGIIFLKLALEKGVVKRMLCGKPIPESLLLPSDFHSP
jgi:hypothetical protein